MLSKTVSSIQVMSTLKELLNKRDTVLVDVRSPWEYDSEHLPGAQNIPLEELSTRINEFKSIRKPVVLYCRSGNRSGMAVNILKQNGITDVYNGGSLTDLQSLLN
jgi:phage shock protein E